MAGRGINLAEKVKRITSDDFIKPHLCPLREMVMEWSRTLNYGNYPCFLFFGKMINLVISGGDPKTQLSQHPYMANPFDELWASSAAEALSGITPSNEAWFHGNISRKEAWFR